MRVALAGNPNSGKTALFNALTGGRAKVGNYPGVTVERKEGHARASDGQSIPFLDLPGTYSLEARTPDERVTREVLLGELKGEPAPDVIVAVVDATNLERHLGFVLELKSIGKPMVLALNMVDLARARGQELDIAALSQELGMPVVPTVAVTQQGARELISAVRELPVGVARSIDRPTSKGVGEIQSRFQEVDRILRRVVKRAIRPTEWTDRMDRVVLHPVWGSLILMGVLTLLFQSVFNWAKLPADAIESAVNALGLWAKGIIPPGPLQSLVADGVISGVGSVLVFLPQILLLFGFILLLEDSGYMARAAFLMDRLMGRVGLHGRAFIPMLSSYACAIPGIMATRTIENRRDRLATILVAPLTTCSARLPVYTLLIAAFIPNRAVLGFLHLQGLVMLGLYAAGLVFALVMALLFKRTILKGAKPPLLLELPTYKWPSAKDVGLGLLERTRLFVRRAGTVILALSVILWFLSSYPKPPEGAVLDASHPAISYSYAGRLGHALEPLVRPIGFNWRIAVALIPGFAAREVMVSALGTVYAVEGTDDEVVGKLTEILAHDWSLPTALSLLMWYVIALQCLSTIAVAKRETNSWRWPAFMLLYLTVLAYSGSWVTYRIATALWGGGGVA